MRGLQVLGQKSSFPALLEPLVTAAFWVPGNAELAYRLTQSFHALAMSAAAFPIYLLARRLGLPSWSAVTAVAISAVAPGLVYIGYLTADAVGYLLVLCAFTVGVRALDTGTKRSQILFLVLSAAAIFTRVQYVVLIVAFVLAAIVLERGRFFRAARNLPVVSGVVVLAAVGGLIAGASVLGRYESVTSFGLSWGTGRWLGATMLLLTIGTGVVLMPGAAAWLGASLARPRDRSTAAFAAFASTLAACLILASAIISVDTGSERFLERYLIVLVPVVALAFLCWIEDGRPARYAAAGIAAVIIALAALVPLSGYAEGQGRADSPTLLAVSQLSDAIGIGSASLIAALAITLAALVAAALALSRRVPAGLAASTAVALLVVFSIGAHAGDLAGSQRFEEWNFNGNPSWVDATGADDVLLVQTAASGNASAMTTSFWNTSVTRISQLGHEIDTLDGMGDPVHLSPDGALVALDGRPIDQPVLIATGGTAAVFSRDVKIVADRSFALVRSDRPIRLLGLGEGVRSNGTLAPRGRVLAYPTADGLCSTVIVGLVVPKGAPMTTIRITGNDRPRTLRIKPGDAKTMTVTSLPSRGRTIAYEGSVAGTHGAETFMQSIAVARLTAKTAHCASRSKG